MKLYAPNRELPVTDAHDLMILRGGGDCQAFGQGITLNHEGVVTGGWKFLRHILKNILVVMTDLRGFPVHQLIGPNNFPAEGLPDRLVAEANAKERNLSRPSFDCLQADARTIWIAGTGRNDQPVEFFKFEIVNTDCIITHHFLLCPQLAKILDNVVGEGIVIIDDEKAHLQGGKLYGISLLAGTLLQTEGMKTNKATGIFGCVIALIIVHRGNFHIIEGLVGFTPNRGDVSFVKL